MVFGPIVISYNVNGVTSLNLDGATAARIFNGGITGWNDPAIQALNPGSTLPAEPIRVVFRSDQSGTTDNFQRYLDSASNGAWGKGAGKTFNGGVGEGAKGNDGAAAAVKATEGSITYNEWSFAQAQQRARPRSSRRRVRTRWRSARSRWVRRSPPPGSSARATTSPSTPSRSTGPTQPDSYPIVLATYEIVCSKYPDPQVGTAVKAFLQSTIGAGQDGLADNGYIPIRRSSSRGCRPRSTPSPDLSFRDTSGSRGDARADEEPGAIAVQVAVRHHLGGDVGLLLTEIEFVADLVTGNDRGLR